MDLPKQGVFPQQEVLESEGRPLGRPAAVYTSEAGRHVWRGQQQSLVRPTTSSADSNSQHFPRPTYRLHILAAQARLLHPSLTRCISCGRGLQARCPMLHRPNSSVAAAQQAGDDPPSHF